MTTASVRSLRTSTAPTLAGAWLQGGSATNLHFTYFEKQGPRHLAELKREAQVALDHNARLPPSVASTKLLKVAPSLMIRLKTLSSSDSNRLVCVPWERHPPLNNVPLALPVGSCERLRVDVRPAQIHDAQARTTALDVLLRCRSCGVCGARERVRVSGGWGGRRGGNEGRGRWGICQGQALVCQRVIGQ